MTERVIITYSKSDFKRSGVEIHSIPNAMGLTSLKKEFPRQENISNTARGSLGKLTKHFFVVYEYRPRDSMNVGIYQQDDGHFL
jgi:hypothetical protein